MRSFVAGWIFAMGVVLAVPAPQARADGRVEARELFKSASLHYNLREYKEALDDFKKAYRVHRDPIFLYNIAQCYRQLGDPASAASFYRSYRRDDPNAPNRDDVERLIVQMDQAALDAQQKAAAAATVERQRAEAEAVAKAAAVPAPTTATTIVATPPPRKPLTKRPWFWAVVGVGAAAVVTGVALGVVFGRPHDPTPSLGQAEGP